MDSFQGVDLIYQKDGLVTRIMPVMYEQRERQARLLAQQMRSEGNNKVEALAAVIACNMVCYRPMLTDEELKAIVEPIFTKLLTFSGLGRNRQVWELFRVFRKRAIDDDEILRRLQFFNSRCCNPPLSDEDLVWIMKHNVYMTENRSFSHVDKELTRDGKTFIRLGETVDYRGGRD